MRKNGTALSPDQLPELLVNNFNEGNLEGVVSIYSEDAILILPDGSKVAGRDDIRAFYTEWRKDQPQLPMGEQSPPLINGPVALTSTVLPNGTVTAEVAAQQPDGTWLWVIDNLAIGSTKK